MKNNTFSVQENRVVVCGCVHMCVHTHVSERFKLELNLRYCYIEIVLKETEKDGKTTFRN